jgi:hypothetical protein
MKQLKKNTGQLYQTVDLLGRFFSWHTAHHLLMASVIASCTLLFDRSGYLDWLDVITLRLASADKNTIANVEGGVGQTEIPATLLLDDHLYEDYFKQSSPLDRAKLSALLKTIIDKKPAMLAIDIDISPGAGNILGDNKGQLDLDDLLDSAAKDSCASNESPKREAGCKIVLTLPMPVLLEKVQQSQLEWMKARCAAGIQFATPTLLSLQGMILRQSTSNPSLGNVAAWWQHEEVYSEGAKQKDIEQTHPSYNYLCQKLAEYTSGKEFSIWLKFDSLLNADKDLVPLNLDYFTFPESRPKVVVENTKKENEQTLPFLSIPMISGHTIFFGGGFSKVDKFDTAIGTYDGVSIHAASYYSARHGLKNVSHGFAWGLDIGIGFLLGVVFQWLWAKYNAASELLQKTPLTPVYIKTKKFMIEKIWLVANFVLLFLFLYIFFHSAGILLSKGLWLNPGPIAIGMFIDAFLSSRSKKLDGHSDHFSLLLKEHPDMVWQSIFVIIVFISLFTSHH